VAAQTGLSTRELFEVASATYVPIAQLPGATDAEESEEDAEADAFPSAAGDAAQPPAAALPQPPSLWLSSWRRAGGGAGGDGAAADPAAG
jgi:hypothetical protein